MKPVGSRTRAPGGARTRSSSSGARTWRARPTTWSGFQTRLTWPEQRRIFRELLPGLAGRRVPAARADPPQHLRRRAPRARAGPLAARAARTCSSPGRSPASRATSSRPPAGTSPRAPSWTGSRGGRSGRRRRRPRSGRSTDTSPARPIRRGTITSRRTSSSRCSRRSTGRHRGKAARKEAHAERARKEIAPWIDRGERRHEPPSPDPRPGPRGALAAACAGDRDAAAKRGLGRPVCEGPVRALNALGGRCVARLPRRVRAT